MDVYLFIKLMKYIITLFTLSSLVTLAGCSSAELPTNTNETGESNTNAQVVVANTNSDSNTNEVENTNETVNENANTNADSESSEVDTSDWVTYSNEEYGFSFKYPNHWNIKQEWKELGVQGIQYHIYLQNIDGESINIFLTSQDFIASEGEGAMTYLTGSLDSQQELSLENLKASGLPVYKATSYVSNSYYASDSYGGSKLFLLTVIKSSKPLTYLTANSPLITSWSEVVDDKKIDAAIEEFEAQKEVISVMEDYFQIAKTFQY